ncbi:SDR family oxidoreductase [Lutimaribacter sp. EGI FJ00015]|uniref:SDR family oxidoreductase n=1 Tax=Lutimaribacter degradans TaxID=2945989 RepID=A0ACC6A083_9RHOB|nr:SDR family oxidoreductase [Lutimaribacter sp. EGI FJ00013]MCM2563845.1 SDR family oxidoreductase [Lutimaribacter sp. EGI FJ00013]MCO0615000.1 SDR family oxidoreductase [Lutimaribacter sp. EGI FJ00015]MCO0637664.1 SDR family oxidoreductase [Lutimaribacter sp. EGI FJ00014]
MTDMQGRKALVTGSATGLGRSMAVKLAERGADVIVNYTRSSTEAEEAADLCRAAGAEVKVVQADVSTTEGARALAAAAQGWGRLDMLVNNAGITRHARDHADLDALGRDDFLDVYAVNVVGPYLTLQAAKPLLVAAHADTGRAASVLNTSSIAGVKGVGSSVAYAASKGALNTMTLSLARALAPAIRVNAICPGFIGTRWFRDAMDEAGYAEKEAQVAATTPLHVASGPDDIADAALFFLSDAARHVTGETLLVDAGMHLGRAR